MDSWFGGRWHVSLDTGPEDKTAAVNRLEAALKLSPGNTLYEQALVWHTPREKLPALLKKRGLGPEARRLAAGLVYEHHAQAKRTIPAPPDTEEVRPEEPTDRGPTDDLERLDALAKADPTNALVHYRKAVVLKDMQRPDDAYAEMKAAGNLRTIRFHFPALSKAVHDSLGSPLFTPFPEMARLRSLTRSLVAAANERLRQGNVVEACETLEECCQMGVNLASSEPPQTIAVLVGRAVFLMAWAELEPVYKDFGMKEELAVFKQADGAFEAVVASCRSRIANESDSWLRLIRTILPPTSIAFAVGLSAGLMMLSTLWWIPAGIARRRRRESALTVPPWSEGWLSRRLLAVYIPPAVIIACLLSIRPSSLASELRFAMLVAGPLAAGLLALAQLVMLCFIFRALHHRYDDHTGERTGILRFLFKAPAAAKAWTRKYVIAGLGAQMMFFVCCFLLLTIAYKPIVGGHPWQMNRFRVAYLSTEQAFVKQITADLAIPDFAGTSIPNNDTREPANH